MNFLRPWAGLPVYSPPSKPGAARNVHGDLVAMLWIIAAPARCLRALARRQPGCGRRLAKVRVMWPTLAVALTLFARPALGQEWLPVGDRGLRSDVELLAAYGLIDGPTTTWPIPAGELRASLVDSVRLKRQPAFVQQAAQRVMAYLYRRAAGGTPQPVAALRTTNRADTIRDFGTLARDQLDAAAGVDWSSGRWSAGLRVGTQSRFDARRTRLSFDGSYFGVRLDNWDFYGGYVEQWYGPGWISSLLLSNNARPFPKVGIMRDNPRAFETPWLSWIGPWQLNFFVGLLDGPRIDQNTAFASLRVVFKPIHGFEVGLTRETEFCGRHHPCRPLSDAVHFDNGPKSTNQTNEEAGIDFKYSTVFSALAISPYLQFMNEDTGPFTHSYTSYLAGVSVAGPWARGGADWRVTAEYTDSVATLNWFSFGKLIHGAAYNNGGYPDGFRYRYRTLGFSLDSDSRLLSLVGLVQDVAGRTYRVALYRANVNTSELAAIQAVSDNPRNVVSARPVVIDQLEFGVTIPWGPLRVELSVRGQDRQPYPRAGGLFSGELGIDYGYF